MMAIRYVSSLAVGGGDGTFLSPWTLQEGITGTLGNDECRIMDDGVYLPTGTINLTTTTIETSPQKFMAANALGEVDGVSQVEISGANLPASTDIFSIGADNVMVRMENIDIVGSKRHGISVAAGRSTFRLTAKRCRFMNCTNSGILVSNNSTRIDALHCTFSGCEYGANGDPNGQIPVSLFYGCSFVGNSIAGLRCGAMNSVVNNAFIRNGRGIIDNTTNMQRCRFIGNTFLNNTFDGIRLPNIVSNGQILFINNTFDSCGGFGVNAQGGAQNAIEFVNNCFYNNTLGNVDINGGNIWGEGNIFVDPEFVSRLSGAEDIRTEEGSPLRNVGFGIVGY